MRPDLSMTLGVLLDCAALVGIAASVEPAWAFLAMHVLGAVLLGAGLFLRLPSLPKAEPAGLLLPIALALFIPLIGALGLVTLGAARARPASTRSLRMRAVPAPTLPVRVPLGPPDPPADALRGILWHAANPAQRARALLRAAGIGGSRSHALLRAGLCDASEDIRLLSHALLTRREGPGVEEDLP